MSRGSEAGEGIVLSAESQVRLGLTTVTGASLQHLKCRLVQEALVGFPLPACLSQCSKALHRVTSGAPSPSHLGFFSLMRPSSFQAGPVILLHQPCCWAQPASHAYPDNPVLALKVLLLCVLQHQMQHHTQLLTGPPVLEAVHTECVSELGC